MNGQKDKNLLKNVANLLGVASVTALLTLPALAQLNANNNRVNSANSDQGNGQVLAQSSDRMGNMNRSSTGSKNPSAMNGSNNSGTISGSSTGSDSTSAMNESSTSMKQKRAKGAYAMRHKSGHKHHRAVQETSSSVRALW